MSLPTKTFGVVPGILVLILNLEVQLVDPSIPLKIGPSAGAAVQDGSSLRGVNRPITSITRSAHRREWSAHFIDLVKIFRVSSPIGFHLQSLLAHVGGSSRTGRHIVLSSLGPG